MPWFKSRVIDIQAVQWTGDNPNEIKSFVGNISTGESGFLLPDEITGELVKQYSGLLWIEANTNWSGIETGEWVLHDSEGFYPCKDDIFKKKYEEV